LLEQYTTEDTPVQFTLSQRELLGELRTLMRMYEHNKKEELYGLLLRLCRINLSLGLRTGTFQLIILHWCEGIQRGPQAMATTTGLHHDLGRRTILD